MRVIVVDHDSTMLEATVRALREHFVIDAVTNKADCVHLLRQNDFDIVIACEQLEDGSGLELLSQIAKKWPATLRVFAADRERLRLLQGKLGPFELFQALAYPINPDKLLATLSLAQEAHAAHADTTTIQHIVLGGDDSAEAAPEPPPPPPPPAPRAKPVSSATRPPSGSNTARSQNSSARAPNSTLAQVRGPMTFDSSFPLTSSASDSPARGSTGPSARASTASTARASSGAAMPASSSRTGTGARTGPTARNDSSASASAPPPAPRPAARSTRTAGTPDSTSSPAQPSSARPWSGRTFAGSNGAPRSSASSAFANDSIAEAASIAAAARPGLEAEGSDAPTYRKAFIAGAGCAIALFIVGFLVLEFRSEPALTPTPPPPLSQAPQYSKEITDQVTLVEADFETDDFKKAQVDVRKLQAMAPDHPRLQFFLTLIDRGLKTHAVAGREPAGASRSAAQRKLAASAAKSDTTPSAEPEAERQSRALATPGRSPLGSTFSGRTIEEGTAAAGSASRAPETGSTAATGAAASTVPASTVPPAGATASTLPTSTAAPAAATTSALPTSTPAGATASAAAPVAAANAPAASPGAAAGSASPQAPHSSVPIVTAEAQLTRRISPEYPDTAMRKGIQGYVDVHFTITAKGTVTDVAVVSSDPGEVFDRAATDAVRRWRYEPRVVDGQPVDSQSQVRLQFRLNESLSH